MSVQVIKKLLLGLAEYYGINLTPNQLSMYAEDLEDLDPQAMGAAIKRLRRTEQFFPKPGIIRQAILGNDRDEAIEASNRIVEAMAKFGWNNPDRAREFVGELGWRVVEREGGWRALCERTENDDLPALKAQWRELAAVSVRRVRAGIAEAPKLPGSSSGELKHIGIGLLPVPKPTQDEPA